MSYRIWICAPARRTFGDLQKYERTMARELIRQLKTHPRPLGSERVVGHEGLLRVKDHDIRVIYSVFDKFKYIFIVAVRKRNEATYKNLPTRALDSAITQVIATLETDPPDT